MSSPKEIWYPGDVMDPFGIRRRKMYVHCLLVWYQVTLIYITFTLENS